MSGSKPVVCTILAMSHNGGQCIHLLSVHQVNEVFILSLFPSISLFQGRRSVFPYSGFLGITQMIQQLNVPKPPPLLFSKAAPFRLPEIRELFVSPSLIGFAPSPPHAAALTERCPSTATEPHWRGTEPRPYCQSVVPECAPPGGKDERHFEAFYTYQATLISEPKA